VEVIKRNGVVEEFNPEKIKAAVGKAMARTDWTDESLKDKVVRFVKKNLEGDRWSVDDVHKEVENGIMNAKAFDVAREYVTYRKEHQPDIFRERVAYRPYEYPHLASYVDAIQQSYWIHSEYNFTSDIQDFKVSLSEQEREAVRRSMLAISQVEVSVKKYWSRIGDRLPKPEIEEVGSTFGDSEVRHSRAYAHLLELLGLNSEFDKVLEVPAIKKRVEYARKALGKAKTDSNKDFVESVLLFSLFIENVSLFSQFLIISQMNKERGVLKGISNVISSTSLEEVTHNDFGCELVNIIRQENPEWFDEDMEERLHRLAIQAFEAEVAIVDWIFEKGELPYLSKYEVIEYIKNRFNTGFQQAGFSGPFIVDEEALENTQWFDLQNSTTTHVDFFQKRSPNYTKFSRSFDEDSMFD